MMIIKYVGGMYPWIGSYENHVARGKTAEEVAGYLKPYVKK